MAGPAPEPTRRAATRVAQSAAECAMTLTDSRWAVCSCQKQRVCVVCRRTGPFVTKKNYVSLTLSSKFLAEKTLLNHKIYFCAPEQNLRLITLDFDKKLNLGKLGVVVCAVLLVLVVVAVVDWKLGASLHHASATVQGEEPNQRVRG